MRVSSKKIRFLVASGPTREPLDPVRYLSNYSTGTMGRYLAEAVKKSGHRLTWVQSPQDAETAQALLAKLRRALPKQDVLIMASAVCDVRPLRFSSIKIKKSGLQTIRLTRNPDVIRELSRAKRAHQVFVGFALESTNRKANALKKMREKKLELILEQRVTDRSKPFGDTRIEAAAYEREGLAKVFSNADKRAVAAYLVGRAEVLARQKNA